MNIAFVQKCPSNINYEKSFGIDSPTILNLSSKKVPRLLKKDVDLEGFDPSDYDYVILVGSEALKMYSKVTSVSDHSGRFVPGKNDEQNLIATISPAMLAFKPEHRPQFNDTVDAIHKIIREGQLGNKEVEGDYPAIRDTEKFKEYLQSLLYAHKGAIALDSETSGLEARKAYMLGISISHTEGQGVYAHADCIDDECLMLLQKLINTRPVVFHNAKFDMHFFKYHLNITFDRTIVHDTMILHYLLDERQGTHGLKSLAIKYTDLGDYDRELDEFKKTYCKNHKIKAEDFTYDLIPWEVISLYAAKDTDATLKLFNKFLPILEANPRLKSCYYDMMLPALMFLTRMEDRGVPVSRKRLLAARRSMVAKLDELTEKLYAFPEIKALEEEKGAAFNPNSTQQLRALLFDHVGLNPTGKKTATGADSTDAETLKELGLLHEIPKLILEIRQTSKLKNTYIDKLIPIIDRDQRVRTGFNLTSTTSGRLSSSGNFNMQQLPRDNPIIKGCVKAPEGYKIVACDLTTAEIYYAAVLSGDAAMMQVFINMKEDPEKYPDFHSNIAHMVFGLDCEPAEVKDKYPALRQAAKAISFGILYGSGPAKVAESVNIALLENGQPADCDDAKAKEYIATYFNRFPELNQWIKNSHSQIKNDGFIYNFFGRKRRLQNINSRDRGVASGEVRSGFNAIIQSVSSDHLLLGAIDADIEIEETGMDAQIFALVHDSVVALVKDEEVSDYIELLYRNIQKDRGCSIPNTPIGVDQDSEPGGSTDYSCGKLAKMFPEIAEI